MFLLSGLLRGRPAVGVFLAGGVEAPAGSDGFIIEFASVLAPLGNNCPSWLKRPTSGYFASCKPVRLLEEYWGAKGDPGRVDIDGVRDEECGNPALDWHAAAAAAARAAAAKSLGSIRNIGRLDMDQIQEIRIDEVDPGSVGVSAFLSSARAC